MGGKINRFFLNVKNKNSTVKDGKQVRALFSQQSQNGNSTILTVEGQFHVSYDDDDDDDDDDYYYYYYCRFVKVLVSKS